MSFVSRQDRIAFEQGQRLFEPNTYKEAPTWYNTFSAAVGINVDENLSVSGLLNRQMYERNRNRALELIENGIVSEADYTNGDGDFDMNRLARYLNEDPEGPYRNYISTDLELENERKEMLRKRREYAQSVLSAGPGSAQFAGTTATFLALEPFSVATMGIGTLPNMARGMSVAAAATRAAGRTAALTAGTELAIQPFVMAHKDSIDSPYSSNQALLAIGSAAVGGALVGGITGGIAGYIRQFRQGLADSFTEPRPDAPDEPAPFLAEQDDTLTAIEDVTGAARGTGPQRDFASLDRGLREFQELQEALDEANPPSPDRLIDDEYQRFLQGEYKSEIDAYYSMIRKLESETKELVKSPKIAGLIKARGGLNKKAFADDGIDPENFKKGFQPGFWRAGDEGMTPDELAEFIVDQQDILPGYINRADGPDKFSANQAVDLVDQLTFNPRMYADPQVQARIDALEEKILDIESRFTDPTKDLTGNLKKAVTFAKKQGKEFTTSKLQKHLRIGYNATREIVEDLKQRNVFIEDDGLNITFREPITITARTLEDIYKESAARRMMEGMRYAEELEAQRYSSYQPSRTFEQYYEEYPDAPRAPVVSSRERELMGEIDIESSYDEAIAAYERLSPEEQVIKIGDDVIFDAPAIIKSADEQLESAEALRRCVRGE